MTQKRSELGLSSDHHGLVIFDWFKSQYTEVMLKTLEDNNIDVLLVPANCTDRLQPLDISVNKAVNTFFAGSFKVGMVTKSKFSCKMVVPIQT